MGAALLRGHLPFLFHITSVSFLLRTLAEKVAVSAMFTDCVALTGKRWAAEEEEEQLRAAPAPHDQPPQNTAQAQLSMGTSPCTSPFAPLADELQEGCQPRDRVSCPPVSMGCW